MPDRDRIKKELVQDFKDVIYDVDSDAMVIMMRV